MFACFVFFCKFAPDAADTAEHWEVAIRLSGKLSLLLY